MPLSTEKHYTSPEIYTPTSVGLVKAAIWIHKHPTTVKI